MGQADYALKAVRIIAQGYETGDFRPLYDLLAEDCVWQSQWRFDHEAGKKAVIAYYQNKGKALRESDDPLRSDIVELQGIAGQKPGDAAISCFEEGKLCVLTSQVIDNEDVLSMIIPCYDEKGLLSRIDVCMPGSFKYRIYEDKA